MGAEAITNLLDQENNKETDKNQSLIDLLKQIQELTDTKEENDDLNLSDIFAKNGADSLKKIPQDAASAIINHLKSISIDTHDQNIKSQIEGQITDIINLLYPVANPISGNTESINSNTGPNAEKASLNREAINLAKNLSKQIKSIRERRPMEAKYQTLLGNLSNIQDILNKNNPTVNDFDQIKAFLQTNLKDVQAKKALSLSDKDNLLPILKGVEMFLKEINDGLDVIGDSEKVENRYNAENAKMINSFNILKTMIPYKLSDLSKLSEENITDIQNLINHPALLEKEEDLYNLYINMKDLPSSSLSDKAKENFVKILKSLKESEAVQNYELDAVFKDINITNLQKIAPDGWEGKNMRDDGGTINSEFNDFINQQYKSHIFTPEQFADKFDNLNKERIKNNMGILSKFPIFTNLTDEIKGKIKLIDDRIYFKDNEGEGNGQELTSEILSDKLGINKEFFGEKLDGANFMGNELEEAIKDPDVQEAWRKAIIDAKKALQNSPDGGNGQPENNLAELKDELKPEEIKNLRSGLKQKDVADFFNNAVKKDGLSGEQKQLLLLAQKGLTAENRANEDTKKLQEKLGFTGNAVDGKFGKNTFRALKDKINNGLQSQNPTDSGVRERNYDNYSGNIETNQTVTISDYDDLFEKMRNIGNKTLEYSIGDDIKFSFKKDSCIVKKNNSEIRFKKEGNIYKEENPNAIQRTLGITNISITIKDTNDSGIKYYKTGHKFEGKIDSKGNPSNGTMIYPDESIFEGTFGIGNVAACRSEGKLTYKNGALFEGTFYEDGSRKLGIYSFNGTQQIKSFNQDGSSFGLAITNNNGEKKYSFSGRNKDGQGNIGTFLHYDYTNMNSYIKTEDGIVFYGKKGDGTEVSLQIDKEGVIRYGTGHTRSERRDRQKELGKLIYKTLPSV